MYRFLLTPRWIVRHVIVLVVLGLFCLAGFWQIHRLHERQAYNAHVRREMAKPAVDLDRRTTVEPYRRITASGRYDVANEVLLRSRVLNDNSGNDLLTPLRLSDGQAVLVDRGWVPIEVTRPLDRRTAPPAGTVSVRGIVLPAERKRLFSPDIPRSGRVSAINYINVSRVGKQLPYPLVANYVLLERQRPANKLPTYEAPPELTEGPHRAYAVQWFLFMAVGIVGYTAFVRREVKRNPHKRKDPPVVPTGPFDR